MRINFFGGPSSGKSTTASWLFSELKMLGYSVELVTEYAKSWTYANREVQRSDQVYLFGKQQQYESRFLDHGVEHITTDSPLFLSCCYAHKYNGPEVSEPLMALERVFARDYPGINIYLDRKDKPYDPGGRYQTKEEAVELDELFLNLLQEHKPGFLRTSYMERQEILDYVFTMMESA